jgi:AraC-like DNA-binding protein
MPAPPHGFTNLVMAEDSVEPFLTANHAGYDIICSVLCGGDVAMKTIVIVTLTAMLLACKGKEVEQAKKTERNPPQTSVTAVKKDAALEHAPDAVQPTQDVPQTQKVLDKDKLWSCYLEIYCAQKRNEMDKILDIYKKCGFENPSDFTQAWIEAAKDRQWVSKLAHEASKACK